MPRDDLPPSLQESILAALLFDEKSGAAIAAQVTPALFDEGYREIAERALAYRRRYRRAPGRAHLDDLFGQLLQPGRAPRLRRLVFDLAELGEGINGEFVVARTQEFIRDQRFKAALVQANSRYEQGGEDRANDIEAIFSKAVRFRAQTLEAGTFLNDTSRSLKFFERSTSGISLGIPLLDTMGLMLRPGEQILYIGPKGSGKSWMCVNVGANALKQGYRVLHVSLEMYEESVAARYYQRIFAAGVRPDKFNKTYLDFDRLGRLAGFRTRTVAPKWDFSAPGAQRELKRRLRPWGARLGNLVVKHFRSGSLTVGQFESYLDYLELEEKFIPSVVIIDYPDLMQLDPKNLRITTGRTFVDLRGVAAARRFGLFTPTQGNRSTLGGKKRTRAGDVSEDISKVFTADYVLTYQRTEAEKRIGLARLEVEHARETWDGAQIVITQSYPTGQFVLQSALMQEQAYWNRMQEITGDRGDED